MPGDGTMRPMRSSARARSPFRVLSRVLAVGLGLAACATSPLHAADVLAGLRAERPRLLFTQSDFDQARARVASDSLTGLLHRSLLRRAEQVLLKPPLAYILDSTPERRLLDVSRDALERVTLLAALYRLGGDTRHRDGAIAALRQVSGFPDWHPSHFLDAAEMTFAVALGYDWLHAELSPGMRDTLRSALVRHGLSPGMDAYRGVANSWWVRASSNWNQVCNGGLAAGALALGDDTADLARRVLDSALLSIHASMDRSYSPDGGYPEGLGYWEYGTSYNVFLLAALQSSLGSTFGLLGAPGFAQTADYRLQMVGPTNLRFNYADQSPTNNFVPAMFWFAKTFQRPFYARTERGNPGSPNIFALLWYDPALAELPDGTTLPLAVRYENLHVVAFRSAWNDTGAWYAGFKGGDNRTSHAHLDLGTFVLDQGGVRWAADLGADSYGVPGTFVDRSSQTGAHWQIYRTRTEGQNTLTIGASPQIPLSFPNQVVSATAPLLGFHPGPTDPWAVADLTAAYAPIPSDARAVTRVHRGVRILDNAQFLVQDEIVSTSPVEVVWNLLTEATVSPQGSTAILTRRGRTMRLEILSPSQARFDTISCHPPDRRTPEQVAKGLPADNPNNAFTKVVVRLPLATANATLAVRFVPGGTSPPAPSVRPLASWIADGARVRPRSSRQANPSSPWAVEAATGRILTLETPLPPGRHLLRRGGRLEVVLVP